MSSISKYKTLIKDTLIFALCSIGSKVILFFLVPFYTHFLTPEEYGISDLVFTVSQLAVPFFSLVIFDAVIRFALYKKDRPQDALFVGILVWLFGSVLAVILTPIFGLYSAVSEWKWYITIFISANMLISIETNYLKAIDKNLAFSIISILQTLSLALLNILLIAHFHLGIRGYLTSYVGSNILTAVVASSYVKVFSELRKARFDKTLAKEMVLYSTPLILNNLSWWVIQSSDKLMLERMINASALGIYTVASRIPSLITVFISIFQQAWGISAVKEMDSTNDSGFYTNVFTYYSFVAFIGGLGLCTIIKPFMDIYVQSEAYGEVWRYVPLLLASAVFSAFAAYCGSMYGALKKSINNMLSTLTAALINIIVNYLGILMFGIWGAMIGTITAYFLLAAIRIIDIKRFVDIGIKWKKMIINSTLLISQAVIVSLCSPWLGILLSFIILTIFFVCNRIEFMMMLQQMKIRR